MGKSLSDKIKELPVESQIKIEQRAHELIALELTRQEKLKFRKRRIVTQKEVIIFRKIKDNTLV